MYLPNILPNALVIIIILYVEDLIWFYEHISTIFHKKLQHWNIEYDKAKIVSIQSLLYRQSLTPPRSLGMGLKVLYYDNQCIRSISAYTNQQNIQDILFLFFPPFYWYLFIYGILASGKEFLGLFNFSLRDGRPRVYTYVVSNYLYLISLSNSCWLRRWLKIHSIFQKLELHFLLICCQSTPCIQM